jgi:hypothetical protein
MEKTTVNINGRKIELAKATAENAQLLNALTYAHANKRGRRMRFYYGDVKTGLCWNDSYDVMGYVSNSTGETAGLILLNNRRSMGGGILLDHCIIRVDCTTTRTTLYKHPDFHTGLERDENAIYNVKDGIKSLLVIFGEASKAKAYFDFMEGKRFKA